MPEESQSIDSAAGEHFASRDLYAWFRGAVSAETAAEMQRHIETCEKCLRRARREYRSANEPPVWTPAPRVEVAAMPAAVPVAASPVMEIRRPQRKTTAPRTWLAAAAAVILVSGISWLIWRTFRTPEPPLAASLQDRVGRIDLLQSGQVRVPGMTIGDPSFAMAVEDLFTGRPAPQMEAVQAALAKARSDLAERGPAGAQPGSPLPLSPFATAVRSTRPAFSWAGVANAENYEFTIANADLTKIWQGGSGTQTSLTLPANVPALTRGQLYLWKVEAAVNGQPSVSRWFAFVVIGQTALDAVVRGETQYGKSSLLLGALYEEYGLYADAEARFEDLKTRNTNSPLPRAMLDSLSQLRQAF